jgi:hypothetical protein
VLSVEKVDELAPLEQPGNVFSTLGIAAVALQLGKSTVMVQPDHPVVEFTLHPATGTINVARWVVHGQCAYPTVGWKIEAG